MVALGLLTAGALALLGSFALASADTAEPTPSLAEAYGQGFLTTERLTNTHARAERKAESDDATISPLNQWTFTSRNVSNPR
jgi:hypothetical protein